MPLIITFCITLIPTFAFIVWLNSNRGKNWLKEM